MGRRSILRVSVASLAQFFRAGTGMVEVIENPLPPDAAIVDSRVDFRTPGTILLLVESEDFPLTADGRPYPELPSPVFRRSDSPGINPGGLGPVGQVGAAPTGSIWGGTPDSPGISGGHGR